MLTKYPPFIERYESPDKFSIVIVVSEPERWNKYLDMSPKFKAGYDKIFKDTVIEGHKYLIRITPVETGRLRGGWTAYLDSKRVDYAAAFMDASLVDIRNFDLDPIAISEGKALSSFSESVDQITIVNSVPYGSYLEDGTSRIAARHFTKKAVYKIENIFAKKVQAWVNECSDAGEFTLPKSKDEGMSA